MAVSVLIADDHAVVRDGLSAIIDAQSGMRVVGVAPDGAGALELADQVEPDVVLLDMRMPGLGGVAAIRELRRICPAARIVVISMYEDSRYVRAALNAGAHDFVGKRASTKSLIAAIRTTFAGERTQVDNPQRTDELLSEREREVAELVSQGHTSQEIADQLGIGKSTVDTYRTRAFRKLGIESRAELVDHVTAVREASREH